MARSTRKRQERFISSFDGVTGRDARHYALLFLSRCGLSWLTDEQVEEITAQLVSDARFSQRLRVRNRAALRRAS